MVQIRLHFHLSIKKKKLCKKKKIYCLSVIGMELVFIDLIALVVQIVPYTFH